MDAKNSKIESVPSSLPTVLLFGRVNVGKSTLFNKLIGRQQAIVSKIGGTTRDSNAGVADWQGFRFRLIDSGGIIDAKFLQGKSKLKKMKFNKEEIDSLVQLQVKERIRQAGLILFLVDSREGLTGQDRQMSILLKRLVGKRAPILLVANKADTKIKRESLGEFYQLALGDPTPISAATGSGTGDLLDIICKKINLVKTPPEAELFNRVKVVILGRPNVGKSTLFNTIIGENKVIVSDQPHTTREPSDTDVRYKDNLLTFIDTAGIIKAKSKKLKDELINLGMQKSWAAIKRADVVLLVIDISDGVSHQDTKLAEEILEANSSIIVAANKWDKIKEKDTKQFTNCITSKLPFLTWAPIIFLSAKDKTKTAHLLDAIMLAAEARHRIIPEDQLAEFLLSAARHPAPLADAKARGIMKRRIPKPKLTKLEQSKTNPPEFILHLKSKLGLKDNYVKYLENRLRKEFNLTGMPIKIKIENS